LDYVVCTRFISCRRGRHTRRGGDARGGKTVVDAFVRRVRLFRSDVAAGFPVCRLIV
jgi:hypothetical protein